MALKLPSKIVVTIGAVALGVATLMTDAQAQSQSVAATASATVSNAFTLVQTTAMNFGTIAAFADDGNGGTATATLALSTAGALTPTNNLPAQFVVVDTTNTSQGVFDVTNAAPTTNVTIAFANTTGLACGGCANAPPALTLGTLNHDAGGAPATDANGALTINVGATLTTVAAGNEYEDGLFSGGFDVTVSY